MTETYILVHIGPVQSWIAQARRTQDLFTGSRLLSTLAHYGLDAAIKQKARVVIPAVGDRLNREASYPNRFLLACSTEDVERVMENVRDAINDGWSALAQDVHTYLSTKLRNPEGELGIAFNADIWHRQINDFLEVYMVHTPNTDDYQADNERLNYLMNARKRIRHITAQGEPGYKCSITGEHEALHDQTSGNASLRDVRAFWDEVRQRHPNKAEFNEGERLCAISTVKRLIHEVDPAYREARFPSTSSIACVQFRAAIIRQWDDDNVRSAVDTYLTKLEALMAAVGVKRDTLYFTRNGKPNREHFPYIENLVHEMGLSWDEPHGLLHRFLSFDGDWLYEDTLIPRTVREYTGVDDEVMKKPTAQAALREAKAALLALVKAARTRPTPYYAIIHMDGDGMGDRVRDFDKESQHHELSAKLLNFAGEKVRPLIEDNIPGRLIYCGGDDVLALVPASDALTAVDGISREFDTLIGNTMSAGIAIVHHTHNLSDALQAARDAEAKAKAIDGKAAFSVSFLRRSGESRSATMKWHESQAVVPVIGKLITNMRAGWISRQLAVEMSPFIYATVPIFTDERRERVVLGIPGQLRHDAFKRIFDRRLGNLDDSKKRDRKVTKEELLELRDSLIDVAEFAPDGQNWHAVATLIELARFLSQMEVPGVAVS